MRHLPLNVKVAFAPLPTMATELTFVANGEVLALDGFQAPELTGDGWTLRFDRVMINLTDITAWQTDPPVAADGPVITGIAITLPAPGMINMLDVDARRTVTLGTIAAPLGHYNALSFIMAPATGGEFAGLSLVLDGIATKDGQSVPFSLISTERIAHACGEYVGDFRMGFVNDSMGALMELTFHLDHLFGRADLPADDPMNVNALGFAPFATGGRHEFTLGGRHLGHVGEGHCYATSG